MSTSLRYDLETAIKEGEGCALCWLEQRQVSRYLQGVSNDGVNNIPLRIRLAKRGGYCAEHSQQFAELAHALSSAILLESFLKQKLENAMAGKRPIQIDCEACEILSDNRDSYAKSLRRSNKDQAIQDLLLNARLCATHLQIASHRAPPLFASQLSGEHDDLMHHLAEFIRKYDYRVAGKEQHTEAEKQSIRNALKLLQER